MVALTEYRWQRVELRGDDLDYLLDLVKGTGVEGEPRVLEGITPTTDPGVYELRAGPYVGRLGLPSGRYLDIHSRFPFADVIQLIAESGRLPYRVDRLPTPMGTEPFVIDVLVAAFCREVDRLVSAGLAKGYQQQRFDRPPYPGQVDINRHLSRFAARPDRLTTRAKRITHDIEVNRALALALDVLVRLSLAEELQREVVSLGSSFVRVGRTPMSPASVAAIPLNRLTQRYEAALGLAELILGGQLIAPREQQLSGASVLFNMPKVWESYVAKRIERRWGDAFRVAAPYPFDLSNQGELRSEADVTVWDEDERLVALYDAKYKRVEHAPSTSDVYQMVTYCTRLGIDEATLVYPGAGEHRSYQIGEVAIHVEGLPVAARAKADEAAA